MTPMPRPQWSPQTQEPGRSNRGNCNLIPSFTEGLTTLTPHPIHNCGTLEHENPKHGRGTPNTAEAPSSCPTLSSPSSSGACDSGDPGCGRNTHHPSVPRSNTNDTNSGKEPMTPQQQQPGHWLTPLMEVVEYRKCQFSNIITGKRNQKLVLQHTYRGEIKAPNF